MKIKILNFINNHKIIIVITLTIFFIFIIPLGINLIVKTSSPLGFIPKNEQDTWINFYGVLIGSEITFISIIWSIKQYLTESKDRNSSILVTDQCTTYYLKNYLKIELSIKNIGLSPATYVSCISNFLFIGQYKDNLIPIQTIKTKETLKRYLNYNEISKVTLEIPIYDKIEPIYNKGLNKNNIYNLYKKNNNDSRFYFQYNFTIMYKDIYSRFHSLKNEFSCDLIITINKNKKEIENIEFIDKGYKCEVN